MSKIFLKARWENLVLITYAVEPGLLDDLLPDGIIADTIEGNAFVSLVAFDFLDTKVKGMKFPLHTNFPEINLRYYVRYKEKRGVMFVREFVPPSFIPFFANLFYNEKYKGIKMKSSISKNGKILLNHSIKIREHKYEISLEAQNKPYIPPADSTEHFFKEHEWGFGTSRAGKSLIYRVEHPFWNIYPVMKFDHNFDFGAIYGEKWRTLNEKSPYNVTFAEGSPVTIFSSEKIL
jgi:uncharacterized protein YqjF (DUF2071 family)